MNLTIYIILHVIVILFIGAMYVNEKTGAKIFVATIILIAAVMFLHLMDFYKWLI